MDQQVMITVNLTLEEWSILIDLVAWKTDNYDEWLSGPDGVRSDKATIDEMRQEWKKHQKLLSKLRGETR